MTPRSRALVLAGLAALAPLPALGHAALIEARQVPAFRLNAFYDTGEPMAGAQVIIYAPDNPTRAWARGTTDAQGHFVLAPDMAIPGRWAVQVRQAGHGAMTYFEVGDTTDGPAAAGEAAPTVALAGGGAAGTTLPQRLLMIALVAWGALGTALYARRRKGDDASA